jgi:tyrosine-protein phosphatase YwqE
MPLPNKYLLVENSFIQEPWNIDSILFDLQVKGFKPILAHPERYRYYSNNNRQRYEALHASGTMLQINVLSLAGYYGKTEKATAEWLIEKHLADFIGTDLHNYDHADAIDAYLTSRDSKRHATAFSPLNDSTFTE